MAATTNGNGYRVIGTRPIRHDGVDKVTGRAKYGADYSFPGMLFGKVLRSPHAHALIKSIKTDKAAALPGVKAVMTSADLPELADKMEAAGEQASIVARDHSLPEAPDLDIVSGDLSTLREKLRNGEVAVGSVLAERATFLLAEKMGKQKAGKLVEQALAKGGSFIEALGQLEKELSDEMALLGYSPKFVDRLLASGHLVMAVAEGRDGVVGGGMASPRGDVAELTGIATLPTARRRGVARAVTDTLVAAMGEGGVGTVFLGAADDAVARIYEGAGFRRALATGRAIVEAFDPDLVVLFGGDHRRVAERHRVPAHQTPGR